MTSISRRPISSLRMAALLATALAHTLAASAASPAAALKVGPLVADVPEGWQILDSQQIEWLLVQEGIRNPREFALSGPGGAVIYATHDEYLDFSITAREIASMPAPPSLESAWGLSPANISSQLQQLASGLDSAVLMASGPGSGRDFVTRKDVPTIAVWVDIPSIYRSGDGAARSGVSTLYFRAPQTVADSGELKRFRDMVAMLSLQPGNVLATTADFERQQRDPQPPKTSSSQEPDKTSAAATQVSSLSSWVEALSLLDSEVPAAEHLERLQPLASALPANPFLMRSLSGLQKEVAESNWVNSFLSANPGDAKADSLRELHRAILARVRKELGTKGVEAYLHYLSRVWPDHRLAEPPTRGVKEKDRWIEPYFGLEMVRITSVENSGFWMSTGPVLEFLRSIPLDEGSLSTFPTWEEASDLAARASASLPTPAEYSAYIKVMGGRSSSSLVWAHRPGGDRKDLAVRLEAAVESLKKRQGTRLKNGDFYLVFR